MTALITNGNLPAFLATTGTEAKPDGAGLVTITAANWYFPIPLTADSLVQSIHILTGAAVAGAFTVESCNFPVGTAADCTTDFSETVGHWIPENPSTAVVSSTGTGWTWAALSGAKTAGAAGAMIHIGNFGSKRLRLKVAGTTAGTLRVVAHGKE